ncbi:MAG: ABC-2 type transport system ATP-binding protein [Candidatus Paceibacteria bacterium]|jgi:ABC-2 type transport system ATP-binding protein
MIRVRDVSRDYGSVRAVDSVSFTVGAGEIVGFLGPNGAGKSTLLKMLCTFLPPSSGTLEVAGHDVSTDPLAVRSLIGYLPEHNALFETMRVRQLLVFMGKARGLQGKNLAERMDWVTESMTLAEVLPKRVRECSKGFRQRIGLACALIHDPPVILLDEPTHGLDPLQVVAFRDFMRELAKGRAILFSSHILAEVAEISDRLLVLQKGQLCLDASLLELNARAAQEQVGLEALVLRSLQSTGEAAR